MAGAHAGFVAALFVDRRCLPRDRIHQREVRREDEPLADAHAGWAWRRAIALVDG